MRNNMDDLLEFTIPDWALSSLINGDDSGLEEEDIEKIDKFVNRIVEKYGNANFILPYEEEMDLGFQGYNDIDRLGNDCSLLYLRPSKNYTESSDTKETIYIYEDNEYTAKELIDLADEMAHYEKMDSGVYIDIDDVYSAIAFLGEDEVRIKGDVMMDGGETYAYGGFINKSEMDKREQESYNKAVMKGLSIIGSYDGITFSTYNENLANNLAKSLADIGYDTKVVVGAEKYVVWVKKTYADGGETDEYAKGGVHKVNRKYDYFAVNKKTNKIVDGWEIVDDVESLKYYAKMDLKDNDYDPKDYNLLSAKTLKARGIDPYSWDSWAKNEEYADGGEVDIKHSVEKFVDELNSKYSESYLFTLDFAKKYAKISHQPIVRGEVVQGKATWGFVALEDDKNKGLFVGDLLKAAGANTPAKGARGNILNGTAKYDKYSPQYGKGWREDGGMMAKGGMPTFQDKVDSISASLLKRKKVSPSVQKDYGKTYSKSEAIESAKRIAGALRKKEKARKK